MNAPRSSRVPVDIQLDEFDISLQSHLTHQMNQSIDYNLWEELDEIDGDSINNVINVLDIPLAPLRASYTNVKPVTDLLDYCKILLESCLWTGLKTPCPRYPGLYLARLIENLMEVYNHAIYAQLRTEMIMANHNAEVLQRTWRRCITDPTHPACRRRLEREFIEWSESLVPRSSSETQG